MQRTCSYIFFLVFLISAQLFVFASPSSGFSKNIIGVQFGHNIPKNIQVRIESLLRQASSKRVVRYHSRYSPQDLPVKAVLLSFGNTKTSTLIIPKMELKGLGPEGFMLRSKTLAGHQIFATDGNQRANKISPDTLAPTNLGALFGSYALLEKLGFAFLHPLEPLIPNELKIPSKLDSEEKPYWPVRGFHLHTMHPLEHTNFLNGWGKTDASDLEGWQQMIPEWESYLEWLIANRQNRVQWFLLWGNKWKNFADSVERQQRLRRITELAHQWGLDVGIELGFVFEQQHGFCLIRRQGSLNSEIQQIHKHIDWLLEAGFDFLVIESGHSEFTYPDPFRMLAWLNEATYYMTVIKQKKLYTDIHISTGQLVDEFVDPITGGPLNFNNLPHYADKRLGIMPHTVQYYALDDPALTYGNKDFSHQRRFLNLEAGTREVIWHPETSYWVSFDIDVPLFLPIYAKKRFHDLRLLAQDEKSPHMVSRMQGQVNFTSGFEWGYWFNDVVTARAAWNPRIDNPNEKDALADLIQEVFQPFETAKAEITKLMIHTMQFQADLLIHGKIGGQRPNTLELRNGQAYLQGFDALDDVSAIGKEIPGIHITMTQPQKLGLVELGRLDPNNAMYHEEIRPLLKKMEQDFSAISSKFGILYKKIPSSSKKLFNDLLASAFMTSLRARQVRLLYDYVDFGRIGANEDSRSQILQEINETTKLAARFVKQQENNYRVDPERIAGWQENPTAYRFGYLWTVRSLYYWHRDIGKAVEQPKSPCYRNIVDPVDVAFGREIILVNLLKKISEFLHLGPAITECLKSPEQEPHYLSPKQKQGNLHTGINE